MTRGGQLVHVGSSSLQHPKALSRRATWGVARHRKGLPSQRFANPRVRDRVRVRFRVRVRVRVMVKLLMGNPMTELWSVTHRKGSHNVTCYPTQVKVPHPNPSQPGRYSIYLPRRDGRLSRSLNPHKVQYTHIFRYCV